MIQLLEPSFSNEDLFRGLLGDQIIDQILTVAAQLNKEAFKPRVVVQRRRCLYHTGSHPRNLRSSFPDAAMTPERPSSGGFLA